jgi:hypothetical protein
MLARLFGVRDLALGAIVAYGLAHPELARSAFLLNLLCDAGDAVAISIPLVRRQGIDRAALIFLTFALAGGSFWTALWFLSA